MIVLRKLVLVTAIVAQTKPPERVLMLHSFGPEFGDLYLSRDSELGVDASGKIVCGYPVEGNAPYCLTTWLCPADYRGPIWFQETASGARHCFELTPEAVTRTEADRP